MKEMMQRKNWTCFMSMWLNLSLYYIKWNWFLLEHKSVLEHTMFPFLLYSQMFAVWCLWGCVFVLGETGASCHTWIFLCRIISESQNLYRLFLNKKTQVHWMRPIKVQFVKVTIKPAIQLLFIGLSAKLSRKTTIN